ncbi:MAG TPA: FadR/GntR family transcriptional regulator [Solirubrobacteraceae bacterium]|jgi:DNA-binding FadR family transcriptional regulator|nr:FadR/GntR family transcriptional regulator [Solirubrobacteraceae bacterium]
MPRRSVEAGERRPDDTARTAEAVEHETVQDSPATTRDAVEPPQLYELIVGRILDWVRAGRLAPGVRLPSERELASRLAVSRSSVREAIAALQIEGIVETKPGAGSFLAPDARDRLLTRNLGGEHVTSLADTSPFALLQAREMLEPQVARVAAQRRRPDDRIAALLEQMERSSDPSSAEARATWSEADRMFHSQIAVISGNAVLAAIGDYIAALMDQPLWRRLRDDLIAVPGRTVTQMAEHRLIYQSIVEGDPDAAALYALYHVRRVDRLMRD